MRETARTPLIRRSRRPVTEMPGPRQPIAICSHRTAPRWIPPLSDGGFETDPDMAPTPDATPMAPDAAPPEPTCDDGARNGAETDVDCGGDCPRCATGAACVSDDDCDGILCVESLCAEATCEDGLHNGQETDTDCGGPCGPCTTGMACEEPTDCVHSVCVEAACVGPACDDGVLNGAEAAVDCGGNCAGCAEGAACNRDEDCADGNPCVQGTCTQSACDDGLLAGAESDVDCGGPECPRCAPGAGCRGDADCVEGVCQDEVCAPPSCEDGVRNGLEDLVDCGGDCLRCRIDGLSCEEIERIWPAEWAQIEDEVLAATNVVRARGADCGEEGIFEAAGPVQAEARLRCAARRHSADMGRREYFAHVSPDGGDPRTRIEETGYRYRMFGENIYAGRQEAQEAVDAWEDSDGHCRNMMNSQFTELGVGYVHAPNFRFRHVHTQNFGRPR